MPGLDEASVYKVTLLAGPAEGLPVVIWCDLPISGSAGAGGGRGAYYEGHCEPAKGRRLQLGSDRARNAIHLPGQGMHRPPRGRLWGGAGPARGRRCLPARDLVS